MDPINIIAGINLIATFGANIPGAKKGFQTALTVPKEKPKTYLQKFPLILSTVIIAAFIFALFQLSTFPYSKENFSLRFVGLSMYLTFSWLQVWSYKSLGSSYSQDIVIFRSHTLVKKGPYRVIRHPQYATQILMDVGAGMLTLGYVVLTLAIIQIPFLILRASIEEQLLEKHFKSEYEDYRKSSGSFFPFVG